jgi:hypothetical protein
MRKGVMIRVAADSTTEGGNWHSPINISSSNYLYIPIPDSPARALPTHGRPYLSIESKLQGFGVSLPDHLSTRVMHLDPDFEHLTYGDRNRKSVQLSKLEEDDIIVFYGAFRDYSMKENNLFYCMFGLFVIKEIVRANSIPEERCHENAHTRRTDIKNDEIVIRAKEIVSGRLEKLILIGEYRDKAYRLLPEISRAWGGISTKDDFIMRAAVPPSINNPDQFLEWFQKQGIQLIKQNF